jgi:hypothetical protein
VHQRHALHVTNGAKLSRTTDLELSKPRVNFSALMPPVWPPRPTDGAAVLGAVKAPAWKRRRVPYGQSAGRP